MAKMLFIMMVVTLAGCFAEPPAPTQYLPPSSSFSSPPASSGHDTPATSSRFGAGNGEVGYAPSTQYGASAASSGFGPANGQFNSAPSTQYGPPARAGVSSGFGAHSGRSGTAPSTSQSGASNGFGGSPGISASAPSTQYSAPSLGGASNGFDARSRQSSSAPSTQYGVPTPSGRQDSGASSGRLGSSPSSQYDPPGTGAGSGRLGTSGAPTEFGQYSSGLASSYDAPLGGYRRTTTEDPLAEPAKYQYSYEVQDAQYGSEFAHQEDREEESAIGEYRVVLPDGRTQIVEYEANELGYNAKIRYEGPNGAFSSGSSSASGRNQGGPYKTIITQYPMANFVQTL